MSRNYKENSFQKPSAEEYRKSKGNKNNSTNKSKAKHKQEMEELKKKLEDKKGSTSQPADPEQEKKQNIIFVVSVLVFLIVLIVAKASYKKMQNIEMEKLSEAKWYVKDEVDSDKVGFLEVEFKSNGTFDIYKSDTQVSCMNGNYSIPFAGTVKLKSEKRGFNPPKAWKCKETARFKYKIKDDNKMEFTFKDVTITLYKQVKASQKQSTAEDNKELLNKKYFINEQAKMLVYFLNDQMFIFNLSDTEIIFGENREVLGKLCLSGEYVLNENKKEIVVNVDEEDHFITKNPMWEDMTEYKEYTFLYEYAKDGKYIVLQYKDAPYKFKHRPVNW